MIGVIRSAGMTEKEKRERDILNSDDPLGMVYFYVYNRLISRKEFKHLIKLAMEMEER